MGFLDPELSSWLECNTGLVYNNGTEEEILVCLQFDAVWPCIKLTSIDFHFTW